MYINGVWGTAGKKEGYIICVQLRFQFLPLPRLIQRRISEKLVICFCSSSLLHHLLFLSRGLEAVCVVLKWVSRGTAYRLEQLRGK